MCVLIQGSAPVLVAFTGDYSVLKFFQVGPVNVFVPKASRPQQDRPSTRKAFVTFCLREKVGINEDQLEWRDSRNTTCRTINTNGMKGSRTVLHRSHGFRGGKARYKDPRCSLFRAKHTRHSWSGDLIANT